MAALPFLAIAAVAIGLLTGGGGAKAPDSAAGFVPANAVAYLHLNTDRSGDGWRRGADLAHKLPILDQLRAQLANSSLAALGNLDFQRDVMPWLGGEAAYAELPSPAGAVRGLPLVVLKAKDQVAARAALKNHGKGDLSDYAGAKVFDVGRGNQAAMKAGWVLIGPERAVHGALDSSAGSSPALAKARDYADMRAKLPGDRLVTAYLSAAAVRRYVSLPMALLEGAAGVGPSRAAEIAFTPKADHFQLNVRAVSGGAPNCSPGSEGDALTKRAPAKPALFLSVSGIDCVLGRALGASNISLARGVARFAALAKQSGVDFGRTVLPLLGKSSALMLNPGASQPEITLGVSGVPKGKGLATVGQLLPAIVGMIDPTRRGDSPRFQTFDVKGAKNLKALSSQITPAFGLDYAEKDGDLVVSNALAGLSQAFSGKHLSDDGDFKKLLGNAPKNSTSLLFSDLDKLLALADAAGLAQNPAYAAVRDDLGRIGKAGGYVAREGRQLNAELSGKNP